jgi:hypothetical protein
MDVIDVLEENATSIFRAEEYSSTQKMAAA